LGKNSGIPKKRKNGGLKSRISSLSIATYPQGITVNIFNTVEYIQTYSLYSKKVSLRILQIFRYLIIET